MTNRLPENPAWSWRCATEHDRAFCWQLHRDTMRDYVAATWGWDEAHQRARFDAAFDPGAVRIIEIDGAAVGALRIDATDSPVRLLSIAIAPVHQRRGVGAAAIECVVREAAGRPVWLQVLRVNPARVLYRRLGFDIIGGTDTHWQMQRAP